MSQSPKKKQSFIPNEILSTYEYLTKHEYPEYLNQDYFPTKIKKQLRTPENSMEDSLKRRSSLLDVNSDEYNKPIQQRSPNRESLQKNVSPHSSFAQNSIKRNLSKESLNLKNIYELDEAESYNRINTNPSEDQIKNAIQLLNKADRLSQKKLHRQLKHKVDQEIILMKEESEKRTSMRVDELLKREKKIQNKYSNWMKELQIINNSLSQRTTSLIEKLSEMEARQKIDTILTEGASQKKRGITYEKVKELSRKEQIKQLDNMLNESRLHLRGRFSAILEEFSSIDKKTEREEITQNVQNYVRPVLERRRNIALKQRDSSDKLMSDLVLKIVENEKKNIIRISDERLIKNHQKKCEALQEVSKHIHISNNELENLLNLDVINYETDVGVADAEMEALRKEIETIQKQMDERIEKFKESIEKQTQKNKHLTSQVAEAKRQHDNVRNNLESLLDEEREILKREKVDTNSMLQKSIITCQKAIDNTKRHIKSLTDKTNDVLEKHKDVSNEHQLVSENYKSQIVENENIVDQVNQIYEEIKNIENNSQNLQNQLIDYKYKSTHVNEVLQNRLDNLLADKEKYMSSQILGKQLEQVYDLTFNLSRVDSLQELSRQTIIGAHAYLIELNASYMERTQSFLDILCYLKVILDDKNSKDHETTSTASESSEMYVLDPQLISSWVSLYEVEENHNKQSQVIPSISKILSRNLSQEELSLKSDYIRSITTKWVYIFKVGEDIWRYKEIFFDKPIFSSNKEIFAEKELIYNNLLNEFSKQQILASYLLKKNEKATLNDDIIFSSPFLDLIGNFGSEYTVTPLAQDVDILRQISQEETKINGIRKPLITKAKNILNQISFFSKGYTQVEQLRIRQKLRLLKEEEKQQKELQEKRKAIALKNSSLQSLSSTDKVFKINHFFQKPSLDPTSATALLIKQQNERFKNHRKFSPRSMLLLQGNKEIIIK